MKRPSKISTVVGFVALAIAIVGLTVGGQVLAGESPTGPDQEEKCSTCQGVTFSNLGL